MVSHRWLTGAVLVLAVAAPLFLGSFWLNLLTLAVIYIPTSLGMAVLAGGTNLISLGQGGFFAVGAYVSALLALDAGLNVWLCMTCGTVAAAVIGYLVGRPVLRLKGLSLVMATLAFGQMVFFLVRQLKITGGAVGISAIPAPTLGGLDFTDPRAFFWLALAVLLVVFLLSHNLLRSRYGRAFRGLGVSDAAARSLGINTDATRGIAFTYAAGLAGLSGAMYAHYFSFISPDSFGIDLSFLLVIVVVVGGMRSLWGAVLGTLVIFVLRQYLSSYQEWSDLLYGLLLIVTFMFAPSGLIGTGQKLLDRFHKADARSIPVTANTAQRASDSVELKAAPQ